MDARSLQLNTLAGTLVSQSPDSVCVVVRYPSSFLLHRVLHLVHWSYSGNNTVCPDGCDAAQSVEFGIQENAETAGPGVNGSGYPSDLMPDGGSGIVTMQGDPGTHSFTVFTVPGCKWTIKVLLEP
jgi:hypothetical protein